MGNIDRLVDEIEKNKSTKRKNDENIARVETKRKRVEDVLFDDNEGGDALIGSEIENADKGNKDVSVESGKNKSKKKRKEEKMKDAELVQSEKNESEKKHKDCSSAQPVDDGVERVDKGEKRKVTETDNGQVERKKCKKKHKGASFQSHVVDESNAVSDKEIIRANKGKKKKSKEGENADAAVPKKSKKKVRFAGKDEVFTLPPNSNVGSGQGDDLVRGKRFTKEEDEVLKQAVYHFIAKHNFGEEEGLVMVLNSSKHKETRGCWREIGSQIPYRPYTACYSRAQILFRRSEDRKWTQEEYDRVMKYQAKYGNKWKYIADELGKHMWHVHDAWRRIHMRDVKKGPWSQQEYQKLFDRVNKDLQAKVLEEKHSKHGMLKDNIPWTSISAELSTRTQPACCTKWYARLTSRMVAEGVWADVDDYVLISELYSLDANCFEDVDWDNILENRSGNLSRKRWNQMVRHIGHHGNKSFSEQVDILAQRYCPHLLVARETWDNKPRVP